MSALLSMRPSKGSRLRAGLVLLLAFAAGLLAGVVIERHRAVLDAVALTPEEEHTLALTQLREEIGLADEQIAAIHAILARRQRTVQTMWEQLRPEVQREVHQVHSEIGELLSPEQRERFHEWLMERNAKEQPGQGSPAPEH